MAATNIGEGVFGLAAEETGLITQSVSYNTTAEKTELKNYSGDVVGVTYHGEKIEVSIEGKLPTTNAYAQPIAGTIALVNQMPDFLQTGDTVAGTVLVDSVNVSRQGQEYNDCSISCTYYPFLTSH